MDAEALAARNYPELARQLSRAQAERREDDEVFEVENLLEDAVAARASDLHLDPREIGWMLRMRIDGAIVNVLPVDAGPGLRLINQLKTMAGLDPVATLRPEEGRFSYRLDEIDLDVRLTLVPCLNGEKLAIRVLRPMGTWHTLDDLGFPQTETDILENWLDAPVGMLLVTGPTGVGKTTTLYTLLHHMRYSSRHIVTLEDPVEYDIDGINQIAVNNQVGLSFAEGTRSLLRLDPDCLMVGEIRDQVSARAAGDVAATGRTLMGSLHSRDAVAAITVMRKFGLDDVEIASNQEIVVSQRLVRRLCPHCRESTPIGAVDRRYLERLDRAQPETVWHAPGCAACSGLGYLGRTAVFEAWSLGVEDHGLILEGAPEQALRKHLANRGHASLLDNGLRMAAEGVTTLGELRQAGLGMRGQ
nr:GspE/PulE family protein [Methylonatrum kenyense]